MNSRWLILVLVVSLGMNIGLILPRLCAGKAKSAAAQSCGWHVSPLRMELGLSESQAQRMENDRKRLLERIGPQRETLRAKRRELLAWLRTPDTPAADLDRLLQDIAALQTGIEKAYIEHSLQIRDLLTPTQLLKYERLMERGLCPAMMGDLSLRSHDKNMETPCLPDCARTAAAENTNDER